MKRNKLAVILSVALAVLVIVGISAYAASNYGTQSDPLVTRSYLTDKLTPSILGQVQTQIDESVKKLENSINDTINSAWPSTFDTYQLITLSQGEMLLGKTGTEILLRTGFATGVTTSSLADISSGQGLDNGQFLSENHMYLVTADNDGVITLSDEAEYLVRGEYSIG